MGIPKCFMIIFRLDKLTDKALLLSQKKRTSISRYVKSAANCGQSSESADLNGLARISTKFSLQPFKVVFAQNIGVKMDVVHQIYFLKLNFHRKATRSEF